MKLEQIGFEILSTTSPNSAIIKNELFDYKLADFLKNNNQIASGDAEILKYMKKNCVRSSKECKLEVNYVRGKGTSEMNIGRINGKGLQRLSREVRSSLAHNYYFDMDIKNCHPVLLLQLSKLFKLKHEFLEEYCLKRDEIFKMIMDSNSKLNKSDIKTIFISILFGGQVDANIHEWVKDKFFPEVRNIMETLITIPMFKPLYEKMVKMKKLNPIGSCCAYILQNIEAHILMGIDAKLREQGRDMDVYIYDGGLVRKLEGEQTFPLNIIKMCEDRIKEIFDIDIELVIKPLISVFKIDNTLPTYEEEKIQFDKSHFMYTGDDVVYYKIMEDKELIKYSEAGMKRLYRPKLVSHNGENTKFIDLWLGDDNKPTFDKIEFLPPGEYCGFKTYNTWPGFEIEKIDYDPSWEEEIKEENEWPTLPQNRIKFIFKLFQALWNNEDDCFSYIFNYISDIVQHPNKKPDVSFFLKTKQGLGKQIFFDKIIGKILGSKLYKLVDKIGDIMGNYNALLENKLLVIVDEFTQLSKSEQDKLKTLITTGEDMINDKYEKLKRIKSYRRVGCFFDHGFNLNVKDGSRRFFAVSSDQDPFDTKFYAFIDEISNDKKTLRLFFECLMRNDLKDWNPQIKPETEFLKELTSVSIGTELLFIRYMTEKYKEESIKRPICYDAKELYAEYKIFMNNELNTTKFASKDVFILNFNKLKMNTSIKFYGRGVENKDRDLWSFRNKDLITLELKKRGVIIYD